MCDEFDLESWDLKTYKPDSEGFIRITEKVINELIMQDETKALNHIFCNGVALAQISKGDENQMLR